MSLALAAAFGSQFAHAVGDAVWRLSPKDLRWWLVKIIERDDHGPPVFFKIHYLGADHSSDEWLTCSHIFVRVPVDVCV